jgi:hypothetical protein
MDITTLSALGPSNVTPPPHPAPPQAPSADISGTQGKPSDSLDISSQGQWASRTSGKTSFRADMAHLGRLLEAGDVGGAQAAFAAMQGKLKTQTKGNVADIDPMDADFQALGKALAQGDQTAASKAFKTMQKDLQNLTNSRGAATPALSDPFQTDLSDLGKLIGSGDVTGAKAAYAALEAKDKGLGPDAPGKLPGVSEAFSALGQALDRGSAPAASRAYQTLEQDLHAAPGHMGAARPGTPDASLNALLLAAYLKPAQTGSGAPAAAIPAPALAL